MKKKLREDALAKRNLIPKEARMKKSLCITEHILQSDAFRNAEKVFCSVNFVFVANET